MIRAYHLYTGSDGNSHVVRGSVSGGELVEAESILFKETPAHSSFDWHNDPTPQYVITLAGVLEFTTVGGETFTIHPGDVLLAKEGADTRFVPDHKDCNRRKVESSPPARTTIVGRTPSSASDPQVASAADKKK